MPDTETETAVPQDVDPRGEKKPADVLPPPQMRGRKEQPEQPVMEPEEAVIAAGRDQKLSEQNAANATDWFLSTDPADSLATQLVIQVNVGTDEDHWIDWTIRSVDAEILRRLRKEASGNRATRRAGGEVDDMELSARMIVEGTVDPPIRELAARQGLREPKDLVLRRFANKPGLLLLISDKINEVSGFNEDNVREAQAAGN